MRLIVNTEMVRRRNRLAMIASVSGMIVLIAGMVIAFRFGNQPQWGWAPLVSLGAGVLLARIGSYNLRRWGGSPRPDEVLEKSMKGFDDRYLLYAWMLPAPYVLLGPQGVYTCTILDQPDRITTRGSTWKVKFSLSRALQLLAQEGLGNPTQEALAQAARLQQWLRSKLPEVAVDVQPVIVSINLRTVLQVTDPDVPVLEANALKKWLRGAGKGDMLKAVDYKALEALFAEKAAAAK